MDVLREKQIVVPILLGTGEKILLNSLPIPHNLFYLSLS